MKAIRRGWETFNKRIQSKIGNRQRVKFSKDKCSEVSLLSFL